MQEAKAWTRWHGLPLQSVRWRCYTNVIILASCFRVDLDLDYIFWLLFKVKTESSLIWGFISLPQFIFFPTSYNPWF